MHTSKLISLVELLDKKEFKLLEKFINAPIHNTLSNPQRLYLFIKKYYPNVAHDKLTKERAFDFVFKGESFSASRIRNVMSELSLIIEDFLVWKQVKDTPIDYKKALVVALSKRSNYTLFQEYSNQLITEVKQEAIQDKEHYRTLEFLQQNIFFHSQTSKFSTNDQQLKEANEALDSYFILIKLRYLREFFSRQQFLKSEEEIPLLFPLTSFLENDYIDRIPLASFYADLISLFQKGHDSQVYQALKEKFINSMHLMERREQTEIVQTLINHVIKVTQSIDPSFKYEHLELYKIGLEKGLLINNNILTNATFTNIVIIGSGCGEFRWVLSFFKNYSSFLDPVIAKETLLLSKAYYYFFSQNFIKADKQIQSMDYKGGQHTFRPRTLSIRIHFELFLQDTNYFDLLIAQILANEKYIQRNKVLSETKKQAYFNLGKAIKKIASKVSKIKPDMSLKAKWVEEINSKEYFVARNWLIDTVNKL